MNIDPITSKQISESLGISNGRVRQLVSKGRLRPIRKVGGVNLFRWDCLMGFEPKKRGRKSGAKKGVDFGKDGTL